MYLLVGSSCQNLILRIDHGNALGVVVHTGNPVKDDLSSPLKNLAQVGLVEKFGFHGTRVVLHHHLKDAHSLHGSGVAARCGNLTFDHH